MENILGIRDKIELTEADLKDMVSLEACLEHVRPDRIFHLAAQSFVPTSWKCPSETFAINATGQINLFEALLRLKQSPLIQVAGSSEAYGRVFPDEVPMKETNPLRPLSPYAVSKVAQDLLGYQYFMSYGLKAIRTRGFNHTGPRRGDVFVTSNFARQIAEIEKGKKPPVVRVGNLEAKGDFTDVRDMVRAYWLACEKGKPGEVYNIGTGHAGFQGQVLTLGDGSVVRGLRLLDLENPASQPARRRGNVVYLASRAPGDVIAASVVDCEVVSPHVPGFSDRGPEGHGIAVLTQNPNLGAPPAPHEGARVELVVRRSLVRTHRGAAVLAANFAARGDITMTLDGNRMDGGLVLAAGVSRPDLVAGARLRVGSHGNLYRPSGRVDFGWRLFGGSSSPHHPQAGVPGATRSLLRPDSTGDRAEGFRWAIQAAAARRLGPDSAMLTDNRVELDLRGTRIRSDGEGAADLVLRGTLSEVAQFQDRGEFAAGDRNVLQVMMSGVRGSGPRRNVYEDVVGPRQPQDPGTGNRLWFLGGREAFLRSNRDVDPAPSARYFADESSGASATRD